MTPIRHQVTGQVTVHELASLRRTLHYKLRTYFCARAKVSSEHDARMDLWCLNSRVSGQ